MGRKRPREAAVPPVAVPPTMGPLLPAPPQLPPHAGPPTTTPRCSRRRQGGGEPLADVPSVSHAMPEDVMPDPATAAAPMARIRSLPASSSRWWLPLVHMLLVLGCLFPSPVRAQMYSIGADSVRGLNRGQLREGGGDAARGGVGEWVGMQVAKGPH
jgi:hypothetical protein